MVYVIHVTLTGRLMGPRLEEGAVPTGLAITLRGCKGGRPGAAKAKAEAGMLRPCRWARPRPDTRLRPGSRNLSNSTSEPPDQLQKALLTNRGTTGAPHPDSRPRHPPAFLPPLCWREAGAACEEGLAAPGGPAAPPAPHRLAPPPRF